MRILDENVVESQRREFLLHGLHVRQVGHEIARQGTGDDDVIRLLHRLRRPTLLTRDLKLFNSRLCHPRYCIVVLDVERADFFAYALRLLDHRDFNTSVKRIGLAIRAGEQTVRVWKFKRNTQRVMDWR